MARWVSRLVLILALAAVFQPGAALAQPVDQDSVYTSFQNLGSPALFDFAPPLQVVKWDATARLQATLPPAELLGLQRLLTALQNYDTIYRNMSTCGTCYPEDWLNSTISLRQNISAPTEETSNYALVRIALLSLFRRVHEETTAYGEETETPTYWRVWALDLAARAAHEAGDPVEELRVRGEHDALKAVLEADMKVAYADFENAERVANGTAMGGFASILRYEDQTKALARAERGMLLYQKHQDTVSASMLGALRDEIGAERAELRSRLVVSFIVLGLFVVGLSHYLVARTMRWHGERHTSRLGEELMEVVR